MTAGRPVTAERPVTELLGAAARGDAEAQQRLWEAVYGELHRVAERQLAGDGLKNAMQATSLVHEAYFRLLGDGPVEWANRRHFFAAAAKAMRRIRVDVARKRDRLKRGGPGDGSHRGHRDHRDSEMARDGDRAAIGTTAEGTQGDGTADERGWTQMARAEGGGPAKTGAGRSGEPAPSRSRFGQRVPASWDADAAELLALDEALTKLERFDRRKAEVVNLRYFAGLSIDEAAEVMGLSPRTIDSEWRFARAWLHRELSK